VGFPRGKALEDIDPETPAGSSPYALFCGLPLKGIGPQMVRSLSVGAPVFVPKSASTASLGGMEAAAVAALAATAIGEV